MSQFQKTVLLSKPKAEIFQSVSKNEYFESIAGPNSGLIRIFGAEKQILNNF